MRRASVAMAVVTGVALLAGSAWAGVQVEDWADTNDHWGDAIKYTASRSTIDTVNGVLKVFSTGSDNISSATGIESYSPNVPDVSYWWDLSGNGYDRFTFTYKNTGTTNQAWAGAGGNSHISIGFKRYSSPTSVNPNAVRWQLSGLIVDATGDGVVDVGETITITGMFDDYDWRSRTDMYGWDTANDRIIICSWFVRKDYDSSGAKSPFELGPIWFASAPPPPAPIPEPAGIALLGIAPLALRRRRS